MYIHTIYMYYCSISCCTTVQQDILRSDVLLLFMIIIIILALGFSEACFAVKIIN